MYRRAPTFVGLGVLLLVGVRLALAQSYSVDWHTIDGGGATFSTGGTFQLGGTIGQPDASSFATPITGGNFTLVGGFWPAAGNACTLIGDVNLDGAVDGDDVQLFTNCVIGIGGSNCGCADFDNNGSATPADVDQFVAAVLGA